MLQGRWRPAADGLTYGVQVVGNFAYVAWSTEGLAVLDVVNPTNIVRVGVLGTGSQATALQIVGRYAYVADWDRGLQVIDVSNPTDCAHVGGYATQAATGVQVVGGYAYVADGKAGLEVIDVSNPSNCVRVGGYDSGGQVVGVHVVGACAYVVDKAAGLHVIDVSSPAKCVRVGGCAAGRFPTGVFVADDRVYVTGQDLPLLVLCSVPNVQFTLRLNATAGVPFTVEATPTLADPLQWNPIFTTNAPSMPFYFVDFEVQTPQKYYRVRQP